MNLSDCSINNLPFLTAQPISLSAPFGRPSQEQMAITICHRMAHLIYRMETGDASRAADGSKWFLNNLGMVPITEPRLKQVMKPFIDRLAADVQQHEQALRQRGYYLSTDKFAAMVEMAGVAPGVVLCGPGLPDSYGFRETPLQNLSNHISYAMWRQGGVWN